MTHSSAWDLLEESGAVLSGHFLLTSGRHSDVYIEKFRLLERPEKLEQIGAALVRPFQGKGVTVVLGAAVGGILVAASAAKALQARSIFAERVDGRLILKRGFTIAPGEKTLVVEDIVTTGGSVRELVETGQGEGAEIVGVACVVDRGESECNFGVPTTVLARFPAISWEPASCPMCNNGEPIQIRGRSGK